MKVYLPSENFIFIIIFSLNKGVTITKTGARYVAYYLFFILRKKYQFYQVSTKVLEPYYGFLSR